MPPHSFYSYLELSQQADIQMVCVVGLMCDKNKFSFQLTHISLEKKSLTQKKVKQKSLEALQIKLSIQ